MTGLRLNPALDPAQFTPLYARDKLVQVHNLFEPETAEALERALLSLPWRLLCQNDDHKLMLLNQAELAAMSVQERAQLHQGMMERAARNLGYTYLAYPMIEALQQGHDVDHPIHALTRFLNSPEFIAFGSAITGDAAITKVDAHASMYQRGHYLTRHADEGAHRRAAYTIGFSRDWQPDWGGLLLFLDDKQDVRSGFVPRFNTLTIFDGLRVHSVTTVSQFAPKPRVSVAGWFRAAPV